MTKIAPMSRKDVAAADPFAPGLIFLRQAVRAEFRAVVGEVSVVVRVEQGCKIIRGARAVRIAEGSSALMPAGVVLDVENHPGAAGFYRATGLLLPEAMACPRGRSDLGASADPGALAAFGRAVAGLRSVGVSAALRDHMVLEVVLWLDAAGVRLPPLAPPSLPERVRRITGAALERPWRAGEVASALAMSEVTLRRKLAQEGVGFAGLLADQRMNRALALLQTTDLAVGVIAGDVGYASASRFAARFGQRFGVLPGAIRGPSGASGGGA